METQVRVGFELTLRKIECKIHYPAVSEICQNLRADMFGKENDIWDGDESLGCGILVKKEKEFRIDQGPLSRPIINIQTVDRNIFLVV